MPESHHYAIAHFRRTGVILPGEADRVAAWLADGRRVGGDS